MFPRVNWGAPFRNLASSLGNGIARVGDAVNLPEMGMSEKFGSTYVQTSGQDTKRSGLTSLVDDSGLTLVPRMELVEARTQGNTDPNSTDNSGITQNGGSGSGGGGSSYSADDVNYLNDQENLLRGYFTRLANAREQGLRGIEDEYAKTYGRSTEDQKRAMRDLNIKESDTMFQKDRALGRVNDNARTLRDSVLRRIGQASGSDSSAYRQTAPGAIARDATQDRTGVLEDYGFNFRDIARSRKDTEGEYSRLFEDLAAQKAAKQRQLEEDSYNNEIGINEKLAEVAAERAKILGGGYGRQRIATQPYQDAISSRQSAIDSLFTKYRAPSYTPKAVNVQAPNLRDYMVDRTTINANNETGQEQYAPYANLLKRDDEQQLY